MNWNMADMEGKPMTDIVVRLRGYDDDGKPFPLMVDAADELERLERVNAAMLRESADWENIVNLRNAEIAKLRKALEKIAACFDRSSHLLLDEELEIAEIARAALQKEEGEYEE